NSLGAIDHLAVVERAPGALELALQPRERVEAGDAQVEDRADALLPEAVDDVGGDAGIDGRADGIAVAPVDEHRHRPPHGAAHLEHLLENVAAGIFQVDQDDVGVDGMDARQQIPGFADADDVAEAGLVQPLLQDGSTVGALVDDDDLEGLVGLAGERARHAQLRPDFGLGQFFGAPGGVLPPNARAVPGRQHMRRPASAAIPAENLVRHPCAGAAIGASTKTLYSCDRGLARSASSRYSIELLPRRARGRSITRMKRLGRSSAACANTGSGPVSYHAPPGP